MSNENTTPQACLSLGLEIALRGHQLVYSPLYGIVMSVSSLRPCRIMHSKLLLNDIKLHHALGDIYDARILDIAVHICAACVLIAFLWDEGRFANAAETVKAICDKGFHLNLWEHAFTHPTAPIYHDLIPYSGDYLVWNGLVPDFTLPEARRIFADHQRKLVDMGVSGFKLDECDGSDFTGGWTFPNCASFPSGMDGEQYHSLFGTLYAQTLMQALGDRRTLSEVRNLGALAASYPFALYSDLYGHEDFITGVVNAGFSGLLWSPEVRHAQDAQDLIRRVQTVVFSPQALVNAFYLSEMPWEMHNCTDEIRALFEIRMALLPYLYTMFYDYHTSGKPPVRALVCDYQDEAPALDCKNEYLFGDAMLVAPIIAPARERDVWLPHGVWYDFFTGQRYEGGTHHVVTDNIPVFVKEGTLLPLAAHFRYNNPPRRGSAAPVLPGPPPAHTG